ncbi:MAG TPA: MMPL family transporter, partial [Myxococcota bacterium]|nr:MMPL family transporter [Myxococcota bacterium]
MSDPNSHNRFAYAFANLIVRRPLAVIITLLVLGGAATWGTSRLQINSNQLDLISQDLREVKDVKRIIDMVGGSGYLMLALRSDEEARMKAVADDLAKKLMADKENVRFVTYRVPVEFVQENMVLFIKTEDLKEVKRRAMTFLREQVRRANPFFLELRKTEPAKLDLQDMVDKYSHVGKKTILDDYYISEDHKMLMLLIKPMWDTNELGKTHAFIEKLNADLAAYSANNTQGAKLLEDYDLMGKDGTIAYGYTGSYKTSLDDSYAIKNSLEPVTILALVSIVLITVLFFRKWAPSLIVIVGMVLGTLLTMGFTYATVGTLNMITSILGGILMGFGVDYGIHFIFRTRIELGAGKPYDVAIRDALLNAGRPAAVAAVVTGGSFMVLLVSEFRGFSQFGFLAGCGTLIIGLTMFSWSAAVLALLGKYRPELPERLVGKMSLPTSGTAAGDLRVPRPKLMLGVCTAVVVAVCAFAVPWSDHPVPADRDPTLWERLTSGVRFNYNTRALMPRNQYSVQLQDEINRRFKISSDPIAVYSKDVDEAREVFDEINGHPDKYTAIDQVVSIWSFVPPAETAQANAQVLAEWREELKDFDMSVLPDNLQGKRALFDKVLNAKPFGVHEVPEIYASQFYNLPSSAPENRGVLTYIYPRVDLWDGKQMLQFADQTSTITTAAGHTYHGAGSPILFATLARIVLFDGRVTVLLATLWILVMHFLDF